MSQFHKRNRGGGICPVKSEISDFVDFTRRPFFLDSIIGKNGKPADFFIRLFPIKKESASSSRAARRDTTTSGLLRITKEQSKRLNSGRWDLNPRPHGPEPCALNHCATPRYSFQPCLPNKGTNVHSNNSFLNTRPFCFRTTFKV